MYSKNCDQSNNTLTPADVTTGAVGTSPTSSTQADATTPPPVAAAAATAAGPSTDLQQLVQQYIHTQLDPITEKVTQLDKAIIFLKDQDAKKGLKIAALEKIIEDLTSEVATLKSLQPQPASSSGQESEEHPHNDATAQALQVVATDPQQQPATESPNVVAHPIQNP